MNYYQPRQVSPEATDRPDAGKWRYTCMNDGKVWPVGYCGGHRCMACHAPLGMVAEVPACEVCKDSGWVLEPCEGHDTPEGAYEHQTEYVFAEQLKLDGQYRDTQHRCVYPVTSEAKCGEWTDRFAEVDHGAAYDLCDKHRTEQNVRELHGKVGDVISSY